MRYFTPMVLSLFLSISLYGQKFDFNAGMWSFVDNREYAYQKTGAKTYLATQTWAEAGFRIDSLHCFMAGLNYMYEYGSHNPLQFGFPIAYYHFHHKSIDFYAGKFA